MTEKIKDLSTGIWYDVKTEQKPASELFPWLRGTSMDKNLTVGRMVKQNKSPRG